MRPLPDKSRPNSHSVLDGEDDTIEESTGWDDDADGYSNLDTYVKNKNLGTKLIKLANEKISLFSLFTKYEVAFRQAYSPSGWTHKTHCPFKDHNEKTPSFHYNPQENRFNCFGCSRGGGPVQFISYMEDRPQIQVARELLGKILPEEEIISEFGESDFRIQKLVLDYADYVSDFVQKLNNDPSAIKYAEVITWPLDAYIRNHMMSGTIDIEQLEGRIAILKEHLDAYGESE